MAQILAVSDRNYGHLSERFFDILWNMTGIILSIVKGGQFLFSIRKPQKRPKNASFLNIHQ